MTAGMENDSEQAVFRNGVHLAFSVSVSVFSVQSMACINKAVGRTGWSNRCERGVRAVSNNHCCF